MIQHVLKNTMHYCHTLTLEQLCLCLSIERPKGEQITLMCPSLKP